MAKETLKAELKLLDGLKVEGHSRNFKITLDQAKKAGGTDQGMCPGEAFLNALGGCKCMVAKMLSESANITIKELSIKVEGEIDPDGATGKNKDAKVGFSSIKTYYTIRADHSEEEIKGFIQQVEAKCPMKDTIVNAPEMEYEVKIQ